MTLTKQQTEALTRVFQGGWNGIPGPYIYDEDNQEIELEQNNGNLIIKYKIGDFEVFNSQVTMTIDKYGEGTYKLNGLNKPSVYHKGCKST